MKKVLLILGVLTFVALSSVILYGLPSNVYFAVTAQGANTGADAADAFAYNDATHGMNFQPSGTTEHLVGTFNLPGGTNVATITTSNITIVFEPGANIQEPWFPCSIISVFCATGVITANGVSNFTLNGVTFGNGVINGTANGTLLANQKDAAGVVLSNCSNCTVENVAVTNSYVHTCTGAPGGSTCSDTTGGANSFGIQTVNSNPGLTIANNKVSNMKWAIYSGFPTGTTTGYQNFGNVCSFIDHCLALFDQSGNSILTGVFVHNNTASSFGNWDTAASGGGDHHDGWHLATTASGSSIPSPVIFDNFLFAGTAGIGVDSTSAIYIAGGCIGCTGGNGIPGAVVVGNVLWNDGVANSTIWANGTINMYGSGGFALYNTIVGFTTSGASANVCIFHINSGQTMEGNICQKQAGIVFNDGNAGDTLQFSDYNIVSQNSGQPFRAAPGGVNTFFSLPGWQACTTGCMLTAGSPDANGSATDPVLNPSSTPIPFALTNATVSASAWQKGPNLTALLTSLGASAALVDINGKARPASGNWDIGAQETSASGPAAAFSYLWSGTVNPATVALGSFPVTTTSAPQTVTLCNGSISTGGVCTATASTVTISAMALSGVNSGDFAFTTSPSGGLCGDSLAAGANCVISFTVDPSIIGPESATFTVTDSGTGSPQSFSVSATGVSQISINPTSQAFGNVLVTTSSSELLTTITNNGSGTVTSLAVSLSGASAALYAIDTTSTTLGGLSNCAKITSLAASATCNAGVTFTPTAVGNNFLATLTFTNSAAGSPQTVPLWGNGISANPVVPNAPSVFAVTVNDRARSGPLWLPQTPSR